MLVGGGGGGGGGAYKEFELKFLSEFLCLALTKVIVKTRTHIWEFFLIRNSNVYIFVGLLAALSLSSVISVLLSHFAESILAETVGQHYRTL